VRALFMERRLLLLSGGVIILHTLVTILEEALFAQPVFREKAGSTFMTLTFYAVAAAAYAPRKCCCGGGSGSKKPRLSRRLSGMIAASAALYVTTTTLSKTKPLGGGGGGVWALNPTALPACGVAARARRPPPRSVRTYLSSEI
jgi:hypothetical protein